MTVYCYCRCSTITQSIENQRFVLSEYAHNNHLFVDEWIEETISARRPLSQRKLGKLLSRLRKGDILISTELSRLGRNMLEVLTILQTCLEKDCQIWTLKENYRLGADIQSKVLAFAFSLCYDVEKDVISQRTRESLARLKASGKKLGRPVGATSQKLRRKHNKIIELLNKNVSKAEIARILDCSWSTLHRYIKSSISSLS